MILRIILDVVIFLATSPCILPLATLIAALAIRARLQSLRIKRDATCGNCSYSIYGLPSSVCPECGADLHAAGVRRPGIPRPLEGGARVLIWTFGCSGSLWFTGLLAVQASRGTFDWIASIPFDMVVAVFLFGLLWHPSKDVASASIFLNSGAPAEKRDSQDK